MENVRVYTEEYFRSLNSIAKRICDDISSTRENYETAWNYLSAEEQNQVINESLIYPDAVLRYSSLEGNGEGTKPLESFPTLKIAYGCKILQDETGAEWRDEHSAPFSWKTGSQLLDVPHPNNSASIKEADQALKKKKPPVPPPKPRKTVAPQETTVKPVEDINLDEDYSSPNETSTLSEDEFSSLNSQV